MKNFKAKLLASGVIFLAVPLSAVCIFGVFGIALLFLLLASAVMAALWPVVVMAPFFEDRLLSFIEKLRLKAEAKRSSEAAVKQSPE